VRRPAPGPDPAPTPAPAAGLFVGLTTLDTIYRVDRLPAADEKIAAREVFVGAGGPATNAAITFAHLGGRPRLVSAIGSGPLADFVRADVGASGVTHRDVRPDALDLPVSAVLVGHATAGDAGARAVVSAHAAGDRAARPGFARQAGPAVLAGARVVLLDGHQPELARDLLTGPGAPAGRRPPVILDGGSWKPGSAELLALTDLAVCGTAFHPPGVRPADRLDYLLDAGPSFAAVTDGPRAIVWGHGDARGLVVPPRRTAVDSLGAGDVFHGAFAWAVARAARPGTGPPAAALVAGLEFAAEIAGRSVETFGPRQWMRHRDGPTG
jgi:sugar/nucleoside kinase (ribokinase family)